MKRNILAGRFAWAYCLSNFRILMDASRWSRDLTEDLIHEDKDPIRWWPLYIYIPFWLEVRFRWYKTFIFPIFRKSAFRMHRNFDFGEFAYWCFLLIGFKSQRSSNWLESNIWCSMTLVVATSLPANNIFWIGICNNPKLIPLVHCIAHTRWNVWVQTINLLQIS